MSAAVNLPPEDKPISETNQEQDDKFLNLDWTKHREPK